MPIQYTPQQLLDQIHETRFADTDWSSLPANECTATVKVVKQKLKLVKQFLRSEEDAIKRRWDGRKADEAKRERVELTPYAMITQAIELVEVYLSEVDTAAKFNKPIPDAPNFGTVVVGGERFNEWRIVKDKESADIWLQRQQEKERLAEKLLSIKNNEIELLEQKLQIKQGVEALKSKASRVQAKIKIAQNWSFWSFLKGVAIGLIFVVSGAATIVATFYLSDGKRLNTNLTTLLVFGGLGVMMGLYVLLLVIQYAAFGRNAEIKNGQKEMVSLKQKNREFKNVIGAIDKNLAVLENEYSSSKAAFEALLD